MALYACRDCGATDCFESSEDTRTVNFITRIEDQDGNPAVVYSGESDTMLLGDPHKNLPYECSACGSGTRDLEGLLELGPEPEDELAQPGFDPELHHYVRLAVTMLGVGWAHDDDAVIVQALDDLGSMLGICGEFATEVEQGMRKQGLLVGACVPGVRH